VRIEEAFSAIILLMEYPMYSFGESSFSRELLIKGGALFSGVDVVEVEMVTPGSFALYIISSTAQTVGVMHRPNLMGGWNMFDFHGGEVRINVGSYILKFANTSAGPKQMKRGTINGRNMTIKNNP
jgi:hypothetical protein